MLNWPILKLYDNGHTSNIRILTFSMKTQKSENWSPRPIRLIIWVVWWCTSHILTHEPSYETWQNFLETTYLCMSHIIKVLVIQWLVLIDIEKWSRSWKIPSDRECEYELYSGPWFLVWVMLSYTNNFQQCLIKGKCNFSHLITLSHDILNTKIYMYEILNHI